MCIIEQSIILIQLPALIYLPLPNSQERPALRKHSPATTNTASCATGAVTAMTTVVTVLMKSTVPLVFLPPVLLHTLPVITINVSLNHGCVMVTMTVVMVLMNTTAVSI